jgi:hypothetical protein
MKFVVFRDYGNVEGWRVEAECNTIEEAINAREQTLRNGGGIVEIVYRISQPQAWAESLCVPLADYPRPWVTYEAARP